MSSAASPRFWAGPIRYCRWASREKPAYFWSVVLGALGPIQLAVVPPVRNFIGDYNAPPIPVTYPGESRENENTAKADEASLHQREHERQQKNTNDATVPAGPRKQLTGYDDE
ncbi:NADH-ubiquinone oxidoreductase 9.5 kDa subunit [Colletotrichum fioriniae PJ7]|uniref:NADH-ubiquinone oxidoreductase 9.5 kDa subunit n=1 Tax=Colletotrichum fioriniae PJ7 TaxID=1445577 RepID=A0A010R888_9PEZI|nr:NADH-ubiquinone oxidoreductase 9.5 kDa subunit [Colletotrichum fioriniae PJ7]